MAIIEAKTHIIKTLEEFSRLKTYAINVPSDLIFVDAETDSAEEVKALLWGFSICFNDQRAFYIPWRYQDGSKVWTNSEELEISTWLLDTCKIKKLINHNIIYDVLVFQRNLNIDLTDLIYSDTILLKHTIDEEQPFGLKALAVIEFGEGADDAQQDLKDSVIANGGAWKKEQKDMYRADMDILAKYAMHDVILTCKLYHIYSKRLKEEGLEKLFYEDEIMPLYKEVTIPMKKHGFDVDLEHFETLKKELVEEIGRLETNIFKSIEKDVEGFIQTLLDKEVPVKTTGNFPKYLADQIEAPLPVTVKNDKKTGLQTRSVTLAKKAIEAQRDKSPVYKFFYDWILGEKEELLAEPMHIYLAQRKMFLDKAGNQENKYIFNLGSNDHLAHYFFDKKGYKPLSHTDKGKPQVNAAFLDHLETVEKDPIANKLLDMKRLGKLLSTYVEGVLERQRDAVIYASFLQFGTTSGRYSCTNPNLQNLPRVKEDDSGLSELVLGYVNKIKQGFIARDGYVLVNADFSQLEPSCVHQDSIVTTSSGVQYIKDCSIGDLIQTKQGFKKIVNKWSSNKPTLTIVTRKGVIKCSKEHKIFEMNKGFVKAGELSVGDVLEQIPIKIKEKSKTELPLFFKGVSEQSKPVSKITLDTDLSWVLGAFLGDGIFGYKLKYKHVGICGLESDGVTTRFKNYLASYGITPSTIKDSRSKGMQSVKFHDAWLHDIFTKSFKVITDRKQLRVPIYFFETSEENKLSFLAGLIDTDGTFSKNQLSISTKSAEFAGDLIVLCHSLGANPKIVLGHKKEHGKIYRGYQVRFTAKDVNILYRKINPYLTVNRKKLKPLREMPTVENAEILEITEDSENIMYDISVEEVEEFVCNNLRVHNCFSEVSGSEKLKDIFRYKKDLYSQIAIDVNGLHDQYSAVKSAPNFLKKLNPELRQMWKVPPLGIVYGMEEARLVQSIPGIDYKEASKIIQDYLGAYPELKQYMNSCNLQAKKYGMVKTRFGRIRHLPEAKELYEKYGNNLLDFKWARANNLQEERKKFKSLLNNAKNFPIQGLATHIVNRAAIQTNRRLKAAGIDGVVIANVHDELTLRVRQDQADEAAEILQDCMENTTKLSVPLSAVPLIARTWADAK